MLQPKRDDSVIIFKERKKSTSKNNPINSPPNNLSEAMLPEGIESLLNIVKNKFKLVNISPIEFTKQKRKAPAFMHGDISLF